MSTSTNELTDKQQASDRTEIELLFDQIHDLRICIGQNDESVSNKIKKFSKSLNKLNDINMHRRGHTLLTFICVYTYPPYTPQTMMRVINLLIDRGININTRDHWSLYSPINNEGTALCYACNNSNCEIIELLLKKGADPNVCNASGMYPITFCVKYLCHEGVKLLIKYGAIVNVPNIVLNPLYYLLRTNFYNHCEHRTCAFIFENIHAIFELLLNHDDINTHIFEPVHFRKLMEKHELYDIFVKRQNSYKAELLNCANNNDHPMHVFCADYGDANVFGIVVDYLL